MSLPPKIHDPSPAKTRGDRTWLRCNWLHLVIGIFVVLVLASLSVPAVHHPWQRAHMVYLLNSARQIHRAALNMAEDGLSAGDPKRGWPGDLAASIQDPVDTLAGYVDRLVQLDYLPQRDVQRLFSVPGKIAAHQEGPFTWKNSVFKIYRFGQQDDPACLAIATRNFRVGSLDPKQAPYGDECFVILRKGGDGSAYYKKSSARNVPFLLPGHHSTSNPGVETPESVLKM